jgi:hypothetical protein
MLKKERRFMLKKSIFLSFCFTLLFISLASAEKMVAFGFELGAALEETKEQLKMRNAQILPEWINKTAGVYVVPTTGAEINGYDIYHADYFFDLKKKTLEGIVVRQSIDTYIPTLARVSAKYTRGGAGDPLFYGKGDLTVAVRREYDEQRGRPCVAVMYTTGKFLIRMAGGDVEGSSDY